MTISVEPPKELRSRVDQYAERARLLGWEVGTHFDQSINGYMFGYVVARQPKSDHVSESVFLCWSWSTNVRFRNQLRFVNAWRTLTMPRAPKEGEDGDWRDNSVGSEIKFYRIAEAMDFLKFQGPNRYKRNDQSSSKREDSAIITTSATPTKEKKKKMTTATSAKKAPAKTAAAKKAPASKKVASTAPTKAAEAAANREARSAESEARKEAQRKQVVKLREAGKSWTEISSDLDLDMNMANLRYLEATEYATPSNPTPKALRDAREKEKLSWIQIMAKFRFATKPTAQKAYEAAGGDLKFQVGRGGRFIERPEKAPAAKKASAAKKAAASTSLKSLFDGTESAASIKAAVTGKKITVKPATASGKSRTFTVGGTVKVGPDKSGTRCVRFSDGGSIHDVRVEDIVKVGR
jgi:hypothetical protein